MCGILGFVGSDLRGEQRWLDALRHRGPDDRFHIASPGTTPSWWLGHTRLAILDLSPAGRQPMQDPSGRYTLVFNGEIFNYEQLRRELPEHRFTTGTDTEVLLAAFARWGPDCVRRLEGMFAFAVLDAQTGELHLARDRLGVKPLYWARTARGFVFASEVRALLQTGLVDRRLDSEGLRNFLTFGSVSDAQSLVEGVSSFPAGHLGVVKDGNLFTTAYWKIPTDPLTDISFDECVEQLRPLLADAIAKRLISDRPVGVFLSGGIDSTAVTAFATKAAKSPVQTFTVSFAQPGRAYDEGDKAAAVARHFGCVHHTVELLPATVIDQVPQAVLAMDQPSSDGPNTYAVSRAVREAGVVVALSGLGGDELFAGYPNFRYFPMLLRASRALRAPSARLLVSKTWYRHHALTQAAKLLEIGGAHGSPQAVFGALRSVYPPATLRELLNAPLPVARENLGREDLGELAKRDPINAFGYLELSRYCRETLLRDTDAMSMAHGIEVRVPLLDHRVVELTMRIPGALKLSPRVNKPLLVAASPSLPETVTAGKKRGFSLPMSEWMRGPLRGWARDHLFGSPMQRLGLFRRPYVETLWKSFENGNDHLQSRVFALVAITAWCDRNGVYPR